MENHGWQSTILALAKDVILYVILSVEELLRSWAISNIQLMYTVLKITFIVEYQIAPVNQQNIFVV